MQKEEMDFEYFNKWIKKLKVEKYFEELKKVKLEEYL